MSKNELQDAAVYCLVHSLIDQCYELDMTVEEAISVIYGSLDCYGVLKVYT